jgi:hypothetical protein
VLELLWEIHRLRATILRADQVRRMLTEANQKPYLAGGIWDLFERTLDAEPCLHDPLTPRQLDRLNPGETAGRRRRRMRNGE